MQSIPLSEFDRYKVTETGYLLSQKQNIGLMII